MAKEILPEEYLNRDFDYTKLTKTQLRRIMYENGVEVIPPPTAKKLELLEAYRKGIHDRIDVLVGKKKNISMDNPFQKGSPGKKELFEKIPDTPGMDSKDRGSSRPGEPITSTPRKEDGIHNGSMLSMSSRNSSLVRAMPPAQEKRTSSASESLVESSRQASGSPTPNNSNVDFCGSSLSSSFIHSSSSGCSSASKRSDREIGNSELRKRAFTSDPTLDKVEKSRHSSPNGRGSRPSEKHGRQASAGRKGAWCLAIVSATACAVAMYFRFLCPYCEDGRFPCIPVPEHSRVSGGRLVCDKGFVARQGFFGSYCIKDNRREREMSRRVRELRRALERRSGDYIYGMAPSKMMRVEALTRDPAMVERLRKEPGIVMSGEVVYSVNAKVGIKTFFRYYFRRMAMFAIPLALTMVIAKVVGMARRKREERLHTARKIMKDIVDVLVRQIYVSTKNTNFPSYVYIEQLQDCFGVDRKVWKEVEDMVLRNSNIREACVENKKVWEWVGPILYKPEFNGSLL